MDGAGIRAKENWAGWAKDNPPGRRGDGSVVALRCLHGAKPWPTTTPNQLVFMDAIARNEIFFSFFCVVGGHE